ncbi:endopeptidase La [endosymbiont of Sipalinus gigas]|uniref:endopeptidase La n=1 Tax=endosymbiont of Sipalinus gigas TaxID=1972134 RepID=UPI00102E85E1|nr:endopeptidase La [endosymbiont of Sipalinus gigas]
MNNKLNNKLLIPILPLRDIIVYPFIILPLFIGRDKSIKCLEEVMRKDKKIILVTQKESNKDFPNIDDLFNVGTLSIVLQFVRLHNGTIKILIEGLNRIKIKNIYDNGNFFISELEYIKEICNLTNNEKEAYCKILINKFEDYIKLDKKISIDILNSIYNIEFNNISKLVDIISSNLPIKINDKQYILEESNILNRINFLIKIIEKELDILIIEKKIRNRIKKQMEKSQKEYYLNEQIKAIQKELGNKDNIDEYEIFEKKINDLKSSKEIKLKIKNELNKLKNMPMMSAESTVVRNYIDWLLIIPWKKKTKLKSDINYAKTILDNDHYGLKKVKERILEYLSVQIRSKNNKIKGPILCFVGPPGVGKTSLGKSIAKATGRKYIKISLGGLKDESEIRGHRRTYIGSMPGKIIQRISKVGVKNPLFLLDEIDKMSSDLRGDPSSALLEVLDPDQNYSFNDHYIELDYDLSEVMFITTSNSISNIPIPLLDRMEIINISSYTEDEKLNIAKNYLFTKQINQNFLKKSEIKINNDSIINIIRYYTQESGVRNLEKQISKICRKVVTLIENDNNIKSIEINIDNINKFLGPKKFDYEKYYNKENQIGIVNGLAWTESGGDIMPVEILINKGKGRLIYTGSLGDIIKESIKTSLTFIKHISDILDIKNNYEDIDIHVHMPETSIHKDGPSAGITICIALISSLLNIPVKSNIAMTGEITLYGNILPIGGLKEKILAAKRNGINNIIIPKNNNYDLEELEKDILYNLNIHLVNNINEVILLSFINNPLKNFS